MPETFKAHKFSAILDISVLLVGSPSDEMIILEYKRLRTVTLLHVDEVTYSTKDPALYLILRLALSLKSRYYFRYLHA